MWGVFRPGKSSPQAPRGLRPSVRVIGLFLVPCLCSCQSASPTDKLRLSAHPPLADGTAPSPLARGIPPADSPANGAGTPESNLSERSAIQVAVEQHGESTCASSAGRGAGSADQRIARVLEQCADGLEVRWKATVTTRAGSAQVTSLGPFELEQPTCVRFLVACDGKPEGLQANITDGAGRTLHAEPAGSTHLLPGNGPLCLPAGTSIHLGLRGEERPTTVHAVLLGSKGPVKAPALQ